MAVSSKQQSNTARAARVAASEDAPPIVRAGFRPQGIRLTDEEIDRAYGDRYPPILTLEEAAEIARCAPSTLKSKFCRGEFRDCVRRGKPLRIWRDRFVRELMQG